MIAELVAVKQTVTLQVSWSSRVYPYSPFQCQLPSVSRSPGLAGCRDEMRATISVKSGLFITTSHLFLNLHRYHLRLKAPPIHPDLIQQPTANRDMSGQGLLLNHHYPVTRDACFGVLKQRINIVCLQQTD